MWTGKVCLSLSLSLSLSPAALIPVCQQNVRDGKQFASILFPKRPQKWAQGHNLTSSPVNRNRLCCDTLTQRDTVLISRAAYLVLGTTRLFHGDPNREIYEEALPDFHVIMRSSGPAIHLRRCPVGRQAFSDVLRVAGSSVKPGSRPAVVYGTSWNGLCG